MFFLIYYKGKPSGMAVLYYDRTAIVVHGRCHSSILCEHIDIEIRLTFGSAFVFLMRCKLGQPKQVVHFID